MGSEMIIKTTAKYQDAEEMNRQKPIIQFDAMTNLHEDSKLKGSLVRASIDSGKDNPFRPDGEIYKSADPIVDYYKFGPNQSRAQSPTDSQLLLNSSAPNGKRGRKESKSKKKKRQAKEGDAKRDEKSCLRRWLCCCCRCFSNTKCCKSKQSNENSTNPKTVADAVAELQQQPENQQLAHSAAETREKSERRSDTANDHAIKQAKSVVLNTTETRNASKLQPTSKQQDQATAKPVITTTLVTPDMSQDTKATKPKSTSRCVIS